MLYVLPPILLALAVLTLVRVDRMVIWKLTILATELGHWLACVAVGLALAAAWTEAEGWRLLFVMDLLAAALLLRPLAQARELARDLASSFEHTFGAPTRPIFDPLRIGPLIAGRAVFPVNVEEYEVHFPGGPSLPLLFFRSVVPTPSPCVIAVHGGGWEAGGPAQFAQLNHLLARHGYAVAAVSYRLAPEAIWPLQLDDLTASIAFLRTHASMLGIDPERTTLLGRSAGGQLAMTLATHGLVPGLKGTASLYAPYDLDFAYKSAKERDMLRSRQLLRNYLGGTPAERPAAYRDASPYHTASADLPPVLLIHGHEDLLTWHRQSVRLHERLTELGVRHLYVELPWAVHAFDFFTGGPSGQIASYAILRFFDSVTRATAPGTPA